MFFQHLKSAAAAALFTAACTPAAEKVETGGLPMWVIEDKDSTIYLTGTVHMLPPDLEWRSPRLDKALKDATEIWLELPMPTSQEAMLRQYGPMMMRHMFSFNRPLSSLLTPEENAQLAEAIKRAKLPDNAGAGLDMMKPWAVTLMLGVGPLVASGFDPESGIDINIARMAEEQGDKILGFETFEQQMQMLASGTEEEQLAALRKAIAAPPEATDGMQEAAEAAYEGWAKGEVKPLEDLIAAMRTQGGDTSLGAMSVEVVLDNRNENWAGQIEERLKGSGVSFIAVGAGHLVGPASVQERLKARGIEARKY
jgi:uncharacterized protein